MQLTIELSHWSEWTARGCHNDNKNMIVIDVLLSQLLILWPVEINVGD